MNELIYWNKAIIMNLKSYCYVYDFDYLVIQIIAFSIDLTHTLPIPQVCSRNGCFCQLGVSAGPMWALLIILYAILLIVCTVITLYMSGMGSLFPSLQMPDDVVTFIMVRFILLGSGRCD